MSEQAEKTQLPTNELANTSRSTGILVIAICLIGCIFIFLSKSSGEVAGKLAAICFIIALLLSPVSLINGIATFREMKRSPQMQSARAAAILGIFGGVVGCLIVFFSCGYLIFTFVP